MNIDELAKEQYQAQTLRGAAQQGCNFTIRPTLRDRVGKSLHLAAESAQKAERLRRLVELLDRNQEVAEILDLLDQDVLR